MADYTVAKIDELEGFYNGLFLKARAALGVTAVVVLIIAMTHLVAGKYSWLLGGVPRGGASTKTFEALIRQLGFGLFPWSAVAIFARTAATLAAVKLEVTELSSLQ